MGILRARSMCPPNNHLSNAYCAMQAVNTNQFKQPFLIKHFTNVFWFGVMCMCDYSQQYNRDAWKTTYWLFGVFVFDASVIVRSWSKFASTSATSSQGLFGLWWRFEVFASCVNTFILANWHRMSRVFYYTNAAVFMRYMFRCHKNGFNILKWCQNGRFDWICWYVLNLNRFLCYNFISFVS